MQRISKEKYTNIHEKRQKGKRLKVYYKEKYKDQSDLDKPGKNPTSLKMLSLFYI